ncbi:ferric reductase transmembrane protein-like protein [Lotmaria passim]
MNVPDINDVALTRSEIIARCRSLAAVILIFVVVMRFMYKSGGYADAMQYHPICMMVAFVLVFPDVVTNFKRLKGKGKASSAADATKRRSPSSYSSGLPHGEIVLRHQLSAFALEVAAAGGFAAIEYVKFTKGYNHFKSPHSVVGAICGVAILCQMAIGTLLRYVLNRGQPIYKRMVIAHKLTSLSVVMTGLMCLTGGLLSTPYAEMMLPSSTLRTIVAAASVGIVIVGFIA